jgi:hypothetical protein
VVDQVESAKRLQVPAGKRSAPDERVNVYLLRQDLPGLLRLQANLLTNDIESSRNLVLRCAVDLLGKLRKNRVVGCALFGLSKEMIH